MSAHPEHEPAIRLKPLGWRNISFDRRLARSRDAALVEIQQTFPTAYEVRIGNAVVYHIPEEAGSKIIGLGWRPREGGLLYYTYMSEIAVGIGLNVSIFEYEDGRIRVFGGKLDTRPHKGFYRKRLPSREHFKTVGQQLRTARLRAQMTQADLAARLISGKVLNKYSMGTIEQLISRFERGEHIRFPELLVKAAEAEIGPLDADDQSTDASPRLASLRYRRRLKASSQERYKRLLDAVRLAAGNSTQPNIRDKMNDALKKCGHESVAPKIDGNADPLPIEGEVASVAA